MFESALYFWLVFGATLILAEILLPGLISVFLGLGAVSVAALLHFSYVESLSEQLIVWFISSTVYIFSIRLLVIRFYPSDSQKQDIDEDAAMIGQLVEVIQGISRIKSGRIKHGQDTWTASTLDETEIEIGEKVKLLRRDNITWIVTKKMNEEN